MPDGQATPAVGGASAPAPAAPPAAEPVAGTGTQPAVTPSSPADDDYASTSWEEFRAKHVPASQRYQTLANQARRAAELEKHLKFLTDNGGKPEQLPELLQELIQMRQWAAQNKDVMQDAARIRAREQLLQNETLDPSERLKQEMAQRFEDQGKQTQEAIAAYRQDMHEMTVDATCAEAKTLFEYVDQDDELDGQQVDALAAKLGLHETNSRAQKREIILKAFSIVNEANKRAEQRVFERTKAAEKASTPGGRVIPQKLPPELTRPENADEDTVNSFISKKIGAALGG